MRQCTARQIRFVKALVRNGGRQTDAAIEAGCSPTSAAVVANRWLSRPWVQEARKQAVWEAFESLAPLATSTLAEIIEDKAAPAAARVKAIDLALNRGGFPMVQVSRHELVDSRSEEELRAELLALKEELGGLLGPVVDVTPVDVPVTPENQTSKSRALQTATLRQTGNAITESEDK